MRHKNILLGMLMLVFLLASTAVMAQTPERIEIRLRIRYQNGTPASGVSVNLVKGWEKAPMGERTTDAAGYASWSVAPGDIYTFETPFEYSEVAQEAMGHQGLTDLSVYTGWGGEITQDTNTLQPMEVDLVLASEDGTAPGDYIYFDLAPDAPQPEPAIPGVNVDMEDLSDYEAELLAEATEDADETDAEDILVVIPAPEVTEDEMTPVPQPEIVKEDSKASFWWSIFGLIALVATVLVIWLFWPLKGEAS